MRFRTIAIGLATAGLAICTWTSSAGAFTRCTWAGTPQSPTGTFTLRPGITELPAPGPLAFKATGVLGGDSACGTGVVSFVGQADAGSTCQDAAFEGVVRGLRGVSRFWGKGPGVVIPSWLYDPAGQVVGVENAELFTQSDFPHTTDCANPGGFEGGWPGMFSSTIVLFNH